MVEKAPTTQASDDVDLVLRMMEGDEQALLIVLRKYAAKVTNALRSRFREVSEFVLEDAVNRAAHSIWSKASEFDDTKGSLGGLFYRCAANEVVNILRNGEKAEIVSLEALDEQPAITQTPPPPVSPKKKVQYEDLHSCIQALPPLQRQICEADLIAGCHADNAYLAEVHHTTKNSIYVSRNKAYEKIRSEMKRRGHFN